MTHGERYGLLVVDPPGTIGGAHPFARLMASGLLEFNEI